MSTVVSWVHLKFGFSWWFKKFVFAVLVHSKFYVSLEKNEPFEQK
jgi:hypothetical protein